MIGCLKSLAVGILSFLLMLSLGLFGPVLTLHHTILNPDFLVSQVDDLDMPALAEELIDEQFHQADDYMADVISDSIADLEPWIKEQTDIVTHAAYDYLLGNTESLSVVIPLDSVRSTLKDNATQALLASPPPELTGASTAQIEQYVDEEIGQYIPETFELDERSFPTEVQYILEQVREYVGYVDIAYWSLIALIVLLAVGIILISRQLKSTTRGLGITFLVYGIVQYAGVWATQYLIEAQLPSVIASPTLNAWLPQFIGDLLFPVQMYGIGLMVVGVGLIVFSFLYKRKSSEQVAVES